MRILPWYSSPPTGENKEHVGNSANPIQIPTLSSLSWRIRRIRRVAPNRTAETREVLFGAASSSSIRKVTDTVPDLKNTTKWCIANRSMVAGRYLRRDASNPRAEMFNM